MNYTIVTTIYNDQDEILELIDQIESQTMPPEEFIIVDGGSNDETISIVNNAIAERKIKIRYICGKRLNISQGFNLGIQLAQESFVGIVAVGNKYPNNCFEELGKEIEQQYLDYAYCVFDGIDTTLFAKAYNNALLNKNKGMRLAIASNHCVLMRKQVFVDAGFFYEKFIYAGEDLEFYEKVVRLGYKGKVADNIIVNWDTPHNWKAYFKQVKSYTIAKMQIYSLRNIIKIDKKRIVYTFGILLCILFFLIPKVRIIGGMFLTLYALMNVIKILQYGFVYVLIKNCDLILPVLHYIKNGKYLSRKYRVDDNNRLRG